MDVIEYVYHDKVVMLLVQRHEVDNNQIGLVNIPLYPFRMMLYKMTIIILNCITHSSNRDGILNTNKIQQDVSTEMVVKQPLKLFVSNACATTNSSTYSRE
jgi:hypothetical protein